MKNELNKYPAFLHHMYNEKFCQKKKIINYTAIFSKKTPIFCLHYLHYHNSRIPIKERQLNRFYQLYYHNSQIRIKEKQLETFYQLHYHNSKIRIKEKQVEIFYHCTLYQTNRKRKNYHENYSIILTPQFSPNLLPHIITIHEFEIEREATYNTHPASYHVEFHDRVATASKRLQHRHPRCFRGCKWRHSTGTLINIR